MATPPAPADQAGSTKSVDAALWWDSFSLTLTELENASLSSELTPNLAKKLKDNHIWFVETVSRFKPPNAKSREALNSSVITVGSHQLKVKPDLKDTALKLSSLLSLDEVQAYIVVERSMEGNTTAIGLIVHEILHLAMLQYYLERQCLLKCTKQIILNALNEESPKESSTMRKEVNILFSDGLERRLKTLLEDLLSSSLPEHMDVDLFTLWAEEILIEGNLVLDILFLSYDESYCSCDSKQWKELCLLYEGMICGTSNIGKLAISAEALQSCYHAKVQLLLILIETLDLENLLRMLHDEMPFRQGSNTFSLKDIEEMDAIISRFETKEAGPLILSWASFLCLISSLPGKQDYNMDIDHASYVRQAFDAAALNYILEILQIHILKASDGPTAGHRSVMRTFISAFIASYEISLQLEDNTLMLILDILSHIYRGEESLCVQFWDRDSFIDGPIRCLLCNLEGEFPFRTLELVRLLSALSEGSWPAECVYNFLDKSVGISSLFEIDSISVIDRAANIVETHVPLSIPGIEGLLIPSNTRGHVLKLVDKSTALVRWEYVQSGVLVLLLRLAQEMYLDNSDEVLATLDLLSRLVSFNKAVCYNLLDGYTLCVGDGGHVAKDVRGGSLGCSFNVVEIICSLVKKIPPSCSGSSMMSNCVSILVQMLKCSPSYTSAVAVRSNIFDVALTTNPFNIHSNGLSSGSWLLSGRLANMLLIDCEQNDSCCPLTLSVLEFTMQLVETGLENDVVLSLVVFSLQYILVNHGYWKYKVKHARWKVTLKVLELMKKCILLCPYSKKLGEIIRDVLLCDSSVHSALFQIVCTTEQTLEKLYVCRLYDLMEIEGVELAIYAALDVLHCMLSDLSQDVLPSLSVFHHAVLSPSTKPIPVLTAMISLMSCFHIPTIQVGAAKLLSVLFVLADCSPPYAFGNACFGLDEKQITHLRNTINSILHEESPSNEELSVAVFKLLTSAAHHQPAFLVAVVSSKGSADIQFSNVIDVKSQTEQTFRSVSSVEENLMDAVLKYVEQFNDLLKSKPRILLSVLDFLKGLWQGAAEFINILDRLRNSEKFWTQLSNILQGASNENNISGNSSGMQVSGLAYRYQCQSAVLQLFAYETFLQKKLLHAELLVKQSSNSLKDKTESTDNNGRKKYASDHGLQKILSTLHEGSVLPNLIKSYASCDYDNRIFLRAKIASALLSVHVMEKSKTGNLGSFSVSLIEKILVSMKKLSELPAFSELSTQYTQRGYSEAKELHCLILNDLYYHLQGELEGRAIDPGSFKELSSYLIETKYLQTYQLKFENDLSEHAKDVFLYDISRLRADLGLDWWEYSVWKASKPVVETLLVCLNNVNAMVLVASAKLSALKSLSTIYSMLEEDKPVEATVLDLKIPKQLTVSCIEEICRCLQVCIEFLVPLPESSKDVLESITAQGELLVHLIRYAKTNLSLSECIHILRTTGSGLRVLSELRPVVAGVRDTMKLLLVLLLRSVESSCKTSRLGGAVQREYSEAVAEASNISLRLLPILCNCIKPADTCTLSLTIIDLVLKDLLTPGTWVPIIQKHLPWQHLFPKLHDRSSPNSIPIILKFLLTIARVREGAQMLLAAGFLSTLRVLFADLSDGRSSAIRSESILFKSSDETETAECTWGLGLAVVTAMVHSLGDSSTADIVDYMITYFFSEKASLISYYINAPEFPSEGREKKRSRAQRTSTSLNALKETENTLLLICMLSNHRNSWMKAMKEVGSHMRERSIHYLAFISRATKHLGETPVKTIPIFCHPLLKEEYEWCKKPSLVNSRSGWFALSSLGCGLNPRFSDVSSRANALVVKDQTETTADPASQTYFSDTVALQIYKIAFLNLKFLCLQAECAVRRADEMGFVDIAHFPELPMPEILHGLQDQGIAIVSELCEANKMKLPSSQIQGVCILLLQMTEMALYLEFCVSQICGIRPVSGHVEDFSKRMKVLLKATEGHAFINGSMKSLKHVISYAFPGLLQNEDFLVR